jgi:hypothetical protein
VRAGRTFAEGRAVSEATRVFGEHYVGHTR